MKLKKGWVLTEMDGDYVVVPTKDSAESFCGVVHLNETAKDVWQGLDKGLDADAIAAKLVADYDVDADHAKAAVASVIAKLTEEGLLTE